MEQFYCETSKYGFIRWIEPETEETEQFRSDYTPFSYELEDVPGSCPGRYIVRGFYSAANTRSSKCGQERPFEAFNVPGKILGLTKSKINPSDNGFVLAIASKDPFTQEISYNYPDSLNGTIISIEGGCSRKPIQSLSFALDATDEPNKWGITEIIPMGNTQLSCECKLNISDARGSVFSKTFEGDCPLINIICTGEKCPPNTCEVECDNHICCYDNKGNPVKEIQK